MQFAALIRNFVGWCVRLWRWLGEVKSFWMAVLVISLAIIVVFQYRTELIIRIDGLVLQLFGILTVAWGIKETRKIFGHPSFLSLARAWFSRRPRLHPVPIHANAILPGLTAHGRGHTWHNVGPDATVEDRVAALEKNVHDLSVRISQTQNELDQKSREHSERFAQEQSVRASEDERIIKKLEAFGTGGIYISAIGAVWLIVGVVLSTIPKELEEWLK